MATSATLVYTIVPVGTRTAAQLASKLSSISIADVTSWLHDIYGITLASDTTSVSGSDAVRTVVYTLGADFAKAFPAGTDQTCLFIGLFTATFGSGCGSFVTAAYPSLS